MARPITLSTLISLLLTAALVPDAGAQSNPFTTEARAELFVGIGERARGGAMPHRVELRPVEERRSAAPVVVGSAFGALAGIAAVAVHSFMQDQYPSYLSSLGLASGAAVGGIAGAALSRRDVAPFATGAGAFVATVPFLAVTATGGRKYDRLVLPAMILPVFGTVLGNEIGQR